MSAELEGKVAIVTGAAGDIGQAYARGLGESGAAVVMADLNQAGAEKGAKTLASDGIRAAGLPVDVADPDSAAALVEQTVSRFGRVDILVNNAAVMSEIPHGGLSEIPLDWWDKVMRVNTTGVLVCARAVTPTMKSQGGGKIINQSSAAAFLPGSVYRVSKHTVVALTAGLGVELAPHNINVNAIAPGLIASEAGFRAAGPLGSPQREARYATIPHVRPDRPPADLVGALLLLASNDGDYINGQTLNVDGGWVIRL